MTTRPLKDYTIRFIGYVKKGIKDVPDVKYTKQYPGTLNIRAVSKKQAKDFAHTQLRMIFGSRYVNVHWIEGLQIWFEENEK